MVTAPVSPLLFLPIKAGPDDQVRRWLKALDHAPKAELREGFTPRAYQDWVARNPLRRTFTVLRHPIERAHTALCTHLLMPGPQRYGRIRGLLRDYYGFDFPGSEIEADYDLVRHRTLFLDFLGFVRRNLRGMTSIRLDAAWATQDSVLKSFSEVQPPDLILREEELADGLAGLAAALGQVPPDLPAPKPNDWPHQLTDIYDAEIEQAARLAYARDYSLFGFTDWTPPLTRP
jgi:hypothetical protein